MGKKRHVDHVHQVGPVEDTHEADVLERVHRGYTSPKNKNQGCGAVGKTERLPAP